jgi:arylsulfatase A-like enzyme
MMAFTVFIYSAVGSALGFIAGGVAVLFVKVMKKWQDKHSSTTLIMSSGIALILSLYLSLFIQNYFRQSSSSFSRIFLGSVLGFMIFVFFVLVVYKFLIRKTESTSHFSSYLALTIALYSGFIGGLYIKEWVMAGTFFGLSLLGRIVSTIGIVGVSVVLYFMSYGIFIAVAAKTTKRFPCTSFKWLGFSGMVCLIVGGIILFLTGRVSLPPPPTDTVVLSKDRPNIVLITLDTLRADHLSCYGYQKSTTPHLDQFAQESVIFKNAYATSPWTSPSHASLFTGMYPSKHGLHHNWEVMQSNQIVPLSEDHQTLAEVLADHGYNTAGIIGGFWCKSTVGLAQGFDHYDDALINVIPDLQHFTLFKIINKFFPIHDSAVRRGLNFSRVASQINKRVFSWLEGHYQTPFFLFINYFDPHHPYLPPNEYSVLFKEDGTSAAKGSENKGTDPLAQYDGEIAYVDNQVGILLDKLKELNLYENTLIIITSDHGEFFGEHGFWFHAHELYQEVIKIPLIIKYPLSSKRGADSGRVSLVDIMPTILDVLNLPIPQEVQGVILLEAEGTVLSEVYKHKYKQPNKGKNFARELKALFSDNYKYIKEYRNDSDEYYELYDIENDPEELQNLASSMPDKAEEMNKKLQEWLQHSQYQTVKDKPVKIDDATKEALKALGYIQDKDEREMDYFW